MSQVEENRWTAPPDQFAVRIQLADVSGFFSKKLVVEPGTRALFIDDGVLLGEVPPGTYTLESLGERLKFWHKKQATVVLTRQEDFPLEFCDKASTQENLLVDVTVRLTIQAGDVALFLHNLLGAKAGLSTQELKTILAPMVRQALWESVGRMSITDLASPDARGIVDAALAQALSVALRRYGLQFGQVQTLSVHHEKFDAQRRKVGEIWLFKQGFAQQKQIDELYSEEELRKIRRQERTNELELLAEQVGLDKNEGEVANRIRRIGIQNRLREALLSARFDEIKNEEELAKMLQEQDKAKLLRQEDMDELVAGFRQRKEDRESARRFLVQQVELERSMEMERLRADLDQAMRVKRLEHEIELTRRVESEENRRWRDSLEKERTEAEHRRRQRDEEAQSQIALASKVAGQRREEEWQDMLHRQRLERIQAEVEVGRATSRSRVEQIESEVRAARVREEFQIKKMADEWQLEVSSRTFKSQVERLAAVQQMNRDHLLLQQELYERRKRIDTEMEILREDKAAERERARLEAQRGQSVEVIIAAASPVAAQQIVDLKKHEATEASRQAAARTLAEQGAATSEAVAAERDASHRQQRELLDQVAAAERAKAEAVAQAYREAIAAQQQMTQQAFQTMGQMGQNVHVIAPGAPAAPVVVPLTPAGQTPAAPPAGPAGAPSHRVLVCPQCRAENKETARFCDSCGTKL